jgi:hypothetical protein
MGTTMRICCRKRAVASLSANALTALFSLSGIAIPQGANAAEELVPHSTRPVPTQVASAVDQNQGAPPEVIPTPEQSFLPPLGNDAEIVHSALSRPQPGTPPVPALTPGEAWLQGPGTTRLWGASISSWEAPALCHRPLYFEDENLERHGRSFGIFQPAVSAAHLAGRAAVWPYLAGAYPPHECIYTLGRDRPGSCTDYRLYRPPVSVRGAVYQGAAVTGLSFVVP